MPILPEPVQNLITAFERLPGIGPKSASRLAFYMLRASEEVSQQLAEALLAINSATAFCQECFNITLSDQKTCQICTDSERDKKSICVVEEPLDVLAIEKTGGFFWQIPCPARRAFADLRASVRKISRLKPWFRRVKRAGKFRK